MPETPNNSTETQTSLADTIERVLGIAIRGRWWILGATCCVPIAVIAVALKLPNRYISQATLLVVQQQVSQRYVEPDSTTNIPAAIESMGLEVLSRNRLLEIINNLGLYAADKQSVSPELLVDRMRRDVEIKPLDMIPGREEFNAFTISFTAANPQLAQQVTSRLTSLFIEQNLRTRGERAANTTKFLTDRLEAAKQRLGEQEQRLQAFKTSNLNELPEQQQANMASLSDVRERLDTVTTNLSQAQQQQSSLVLSLSDRLARLQSARTALLVHYTPRYPEVVKTDKQIATVQAVLERLKTSTPSSETSETDPIDDPALELILRQAETNATQLASLSKQQKRLTAESERIQRHFNLAPLREQQLAEIMRDYNLYKQDYTDLLNKKLQSEMTTTLEENQEGQQFRLVDPPSLPVRPASPKRLKIALGGLAAGFVLGLALAVLMDMRDSSFHSEKALSGSYSFPLIVAVPLMRTAAERRARRRRMVWECLIGSLMMLAMCVVELYVIKNG